MPLFFLEIIVIFIVVVLLVLILVVVLLILVLILIVVFLVVVLVVIVVVVVIHFSSLLSTVSILPIHFYFIQKSLFYLNFSRKNVIITSSAYF